MIHHTARTRQGRFINVDLPRQKTQKKNIKLQTEPAASRAGDEYDVIGLSSGLNAVHFDRIQRDRVGPSQRTAGARSAPISITGRVVSAARALCCIHNSKRSGASAAAVGRSDSRPITVLRQSLLRHRQHPRSSSSSSSRGRAVRLCLLFGECTSLARCGLLLSNYCRDVNEDDSRAVSSWLFWVSRHPNPEIQF